VALGRQSRLYHRLLGNYTAQGLKPTRFLRLFGTTEVVPCYKTLGLDEHSCGCRQRQEQPQILRYAQDDSYFFGTGCAIGNSAVATSSTLSRLSTQRRHALAIRRSHRGSEGAWLQLKLGPFQFDFE